MHTNDSLRYEAGYMLFIVFSLISQLNQGLTERHNKIECWIFVTATVSFLRK